MVRKLVTALLVALLAVPMVGAGVAHSAHLDCGDVVEQSTVLDGDIGPCPGDGLVVRGAGVTLDLGGHVVRGTGSFASAGIRIDADVVRVRNGTVTGFSSGVSTVRSFGSVERLAVVGNGTGVSMFGGMGNAVTGSSVRGNSSDGIQIVRSRDNSVGGNVIADNGRSGVTIESLQGVITRASGNSVAGNSISRNGGAGVSLSSNSEGTRVGRNTIVGNGSHGVALASGFLASGGSSNFVVGNAGNGIVVGRSFFPTVSQVPNILQANTARDNGSLPDTFDLADRNPNCAGSSWSGNVFVTRNQPCIA